MTVPIFWPTEHYFEPIGTTSASCLTRDLPPEASANILLLNCTDCRNVLFTVFCEPVDCECLTFFVGSGLWLMCTLAAQRRLDFTCSDIDPGILGQSP